MIILSKRRKVGVLSGVVATEEKLKKKTQCRLIKKRDERGQNDHLSWTDKQSSKEQERFEQLKLAAITTYKIKLV